MNILIVYYSRTGTTRKLAKALSEKLNADVEEIVDLVDRSGSLGYLAAGKDATLKKLTRIKPIDKKPSKYDIIIFGTPIWAWTMTPAMRSYITQNKLFLMNKRFAFFCTMGGSGDQRTFEAMEDILGAKPLATISFLTRDVLKDTEVFKSAVEGFVKDIQNLPKN